MRLQNHFIHPTRRPKGIALLAGLVLLTALSLLALIAAASMLSQQRMAANFSDAETAYASAERALSAGRSLLLSTPEDRRASDCATACFLPPTDSIIRAAGELPALPEFEAPAWWQTEGVSPGTDPLTAQPPPTGTGSWVGAPRFTLEEIAFRTAADIAAPPEAPGIEGIGYYRILGRGTGRRQTAIAVNEAIVARPWTGAAAGESPPSDWTGFCAPFRPWYDCGQMAWRARR